MYIYMYTTMYLHVYVHVYIQCIYMYMYMYTPLMRLVCIWECTMLGVQSQLPVGNIVYTYHSPEYKREMSLNACIFTNLLKHITLIRLQFSLKLNTHIFSMGLDDIPKLIFLCDIAV